MLRAEWGMPLRIFYTDVGIKEFDEHSLLVDKSGNSRFFRSSYKDKTFGTMDFQYGNECDRKTMLNSYNPDNSTGTVTNRFNYYKDVKINPSRLILFFNPLFR